MSDCECPGKLKCSPLGSSVFLDLMYPTCSERRFENFLFVLPRYADALLLCCCCVVVAGVLEPVLTVKLTLHFRHFHA